MEDNYSELAEKIKGLNLGKLNIQDAIEKIRIASLPRVKAPLLPEVIPREKITDQKLDKLSSDITLNNKTLENIDLKTENILFKLEQLFKITVENNKLSEEYMVEITERLHEIKINSDEKDIYTKITESAKETLATKGIEYTLTFICMAVKCLLLGIKNS